MRDVIRFEAALPALIGTAFAFQTPMVQGGGLPPPGAVWQVPCTAYGVSGQVAVTNGTNGYISGSNVQLTVTFTCGGLANAQPPTQSPSSDCALYR